LASEVRVAQGDLTLMNASLTADQGLVSNGAALKGTGAVFGNVFVEQGGLFSVGTSPGAMAISGNLIFDRGILGIEFGGIGAGLYDSIYVGGIADLSNTDIIFSFINGFSPTVG